MKRSRSRRTFYDHSSPWCPKILRIEIVNIVLGSKQIIRV